MRLKNNIPFALALCAMSVALCAMGCGSKDAGESAKPLPTAQEQIQRVQNNPNMSPAARESAIKVLSNPVPNATSQH